MRRFRGVVLGVLVVFTLLFTGCGGDDDDNSAFALGECRLGTPDCRLR